MTRRPPVLDGTRIRLARDIYGWTQGELAARAGISQQLVSKLENGTLTQTDRLDELAEATGFARSWFETRLEHDLGGATTVRYRKTSKASKADERMANARLTVAYELALGLGELAPLPRVSLRPVDDADPDAAAIAVRSQLGLPADGPVRNLTRAAERAGIIVVALRSELGEAVRFLNHHGVSAWPDPTDRPIVGYSAADPGDRQRFTLAHELGHLVLHNGPAPPGRDFEDEAHAFAGALLMPPTDATEVFAGQVTLRHLAELKSHWGMSIAALIMRAAATGAISDRQKESLFRQLSARGWRRMEPVVVHREEPRLVPWLIERGLGPAKSAKALSGKAGLPPMLMRELTSIGGRVTGESSVIPLARDRSSAGT